MEPGELAGLEETPETRAIPLLRLTPPEPATGPDARLLGPGNSVRGGDKWDKWAAE